MNKKLCITPLLLLVILIQSCVTAKITSNKESSYTKQPKRIFILMAGAKQANSFGATFIAGLSTRLKEKGVESGSYIRNPLSLDTDQDINKKIDDFSPEAVMFFKQKIIHSTNGGVDGGTFEITLIDGETKKPVWKSEFEIYGQFGIEQASSKAVDELIKKLEEDKII